MAAQVNDFHYWPKLSGHLAYAFKMHFYCNQVQLVWLFSVNVSQLLMQILRIVVEILLHFTCNDMMTFVGNL